ncbi:DUF4340 domain-containing protein [Paenibacillus sp. FSL H7-689]|uniref:DUF4340 domain-containing protein n=1 Tax=Paenibacillus sp. FSL H7-689 TaxID=1227349 RepID=UPI0003E24A62|nr:DUF4340 domain-containing protein [Paenibacillus sp. FSL H7-689]ETT56052.1 hypothetical protein C170_01154 [Paenibacillus sp. FSL H7-689]
MRKWVPTILVVIVLIVGWVYAASQNYFREEEAVQAKLLGIQSGDVQSITIHDTTEETSDVAATSTLTLENGVWQMVEPKAYPLNGYSVSSWLDALSDANQELVVEEAPKDLNKYGLGTDARRMDIKLKDNREIKLAIGGQLPADDARYVRVDSGPVVAVQTEAITSIALSRRDLLDTTPFNMDETNVGSLEWEGEAATWMLKTTLENDAAEQTWTLNGKTIEATDAVSLIGKIKNLSTADDVRKASELKNSVPRFTLSVEQTVNGQQVRDVYRGLTVPSEPNQIWVITPDGQWAYGMDTTSLTEAEKFPDTIKASTTSSEESSSSANDETSTDGK